MEFEHPHDMRVHQSNRELPLTAKRFDADVVRDENLERNRCVRDPIGSEPGFGGAARAQPPDQGVPIGESRTFGQRPHR